MSPIDPDRTIRSLSAQSSADSVLESEPTKPTVYAGLPAALRPPAPGCPEATDEELAAVPPLKDLPLLMLPADYPLPPTLEYGFPITLDQISAICSQYNPSKPINILTESGFISMIAQARISMALSERCGHPVQLSTVINHPGGHFMTFGNNYNFASLKRTLKGKHVRKLQEALGTETPPTWFIDYGSTYWRDW
ncbi:hypothetical protein EWM64_g9428 [Hericium alpestre]|uniref:Uncharacterized protein n=1 Tax=Hericium alpestre TaxID=135208 RepID=A0A4Y9ZKN3_9AGAM|nr:hypothetical protein EWM64_g9428 [Hericium alpestre]